MKFKEKRGDVFVFDGGYAGEELELTTGLTSYYFKSLRITTDLIIFTDDWSSYKDIQTAVNLMQILIKEGLV